ncbi:MAG: helix-turn-helix transcriptional regulator [Kineosporiaceae bacterium]|nr:helix-turn-helix transcriptional regulator [Kineosporiaceae bacterium]
MATSADVPVTNDQREFASRLQRLRREAGLTQTQLAGDELSPSYVSLLESGKRLPSRDVVELLAKRLGCSATRLWEGRVSERERRIELRDRLRPLGHGTRGRERRARPAHSVARRGAPRRAERGRGSVTAGPRP